MAEPEITVQKTIYTVPMSVIGVDEMGRTRVICPHCSEEAYINAGGQVVCSMWQSVGNFLAANYDRIVTALDD